MLRRYSRANRSLPRPTRQMAYRGFAVHLVMGQIVHNEALNRESYQRRITELSKYSEEDS